MGLKIVRYVLQCSEKLEISKSDKKIKIWKLSPWACLVWKMFPHLGRVFLRYLEAPSSHTRKEIENIGKQSNFIKNSYFFYIEPPHFYQPMAGLYVFCIQSLPWLFKICYFLLPDGFSVWCHFAWLRQLLSVCSAPLRCIPMTLNAVA